MVLSPIEQSLYVLHCTIVFIATKIRHFLNIGVKPKRTKRKSESTKIRERHRPDYFHKKSYIFASL